MARLFVALDLPEDVVAAIGRLRGDLGGAKWVRPEQLHLTLRFLGEVRDEAVGAVSAAIASVAAPAFDLSIAGVGVFPGGRKPPRVLWAGVRPHEPLAALKAAVDRALAPIVGEDAEADARGFAPHLTLARFKERPDRALGAFLRTHAALTSAPWRVRELHLFRSHLATDGARHERLTTCALAG